jgi:hypothetical protein
VTGECLATATVSGIVKNPTHVRHGGDDSRAQLRAQIQIADKKLTAKSKITRASRDSLMQANSETKNFFIDDASCMNTLKV